MKESFLHFVWQYGLFDHKNLRCSEGKVLEIAQRGQLNTDGGPDFAMAQVRLDSLLLTGAVEIHVKSSDWFAHKHQDDPAYNNTILHAVYLHDTEVRTQSGHSPATLELQHRIPKGMYGDFDTLLSQFHFPSCAGHTPDFSAITEAWLQHPLQLRLQHKAQQIDKVLLESQGDWEAVFYRVLARSLGGKVNAQAMDTLCSAAPLSLIRKMQEDPFQLEAFLLGQAGLLPAKTQDAYVQALIKEARYLQHKHQVSPMNPAAWKYLRMRPAGFPDMRIAQFAALLYKKYPMFRSLMECRSLDQAKMLLSAEASPFWTAHYTLRDSSTSHSAYIGESTLQHLLINAVLPTLYAYGQHLRQPKTMNKALDWLSQLPPENNKYTRVFEKLGMPNRHAAQSQAILGLKTEYCDRKQCLQCPVGMRIISKKPVPSDM